MAAAAIAVAKFASAAFASATAAVAGGLTAMGMSAATATAVATQVVTTAATIAVTTGISYLLRPSTPSSGLTLDFKPDPKAPVTGMMGYAATGGNKVFQSTWGYNNVVLSLGAALSLGPIDAITQFRADDKVVSFTGSQNEAVGFYDDDMWQKTTLGLPTDAALLPPTGLKYGSPGLSGWGANNAAKGVAFAFWTMVLAKKPEDRNIFVNGVPDPRWIGRWMKLYDWRKDSTYPGGSGAHRENDWRTWEFSENPYVHARAWLRGHHVMNVDGSVDFNKRLAGVGVNPAAIDMPAFNEGANVADANNWKISGSWSSSDSKWDTLVSMLKAGSGAPQQNGAMISVLVNTPRVSTETVTRDNIVGDIQINTMTRRRERKNTIVPRYRSEAHSWEFVPAGAVTSSVYRAEDDNQLRSLEIQYTYVRDAKQAAELAAYDLANLRESIKVSATLKVDALSIRAGDCITFNVPEVGLENQKCIVIRKTTDYQTAMVTVECRSETDGKHAWALGQAANPPPTPSLSANDPLYMPAPLPIDWTVTPQPPSGGTSQPIINVEGPIDRGDIASVVVEYGLSETGPWLSAGPADPATGKYQISGLNPGASYWVSVRYVANNGIISERYVTGPHIAPSLVADVDPSNPIFTDLENQIDELFDTTTIIEGDLAAAETLINSVNSEVIAARQGQPNLSARITTNNQERIDGDANNAAAIASTQLEVTNARDGQPNLSARITEVNQARVDGDTNNAAAISATQLEVTNARQGSPNLSARITENNQARIDGDENNATAIASTQLEVTNARGGQPNLGARITEVNQARIDGDNTNASAISATQLEVTNARQGEPTLSANITNVKTAIVNEATTRATEISRVEASTEHRANLIDNPSGDAGFRSWIKEGGPNSYIIEDNAVGNIFVVEDYIVSQTYSCSAGETHSLSYNASPLGDGGGVRVQYITPSGIVEGVSVPSGSGGIEVRRESTSPSTAPSGVTGFRLVIAPPSGGAIPVWAIKVNFGSVPVIFSDDYTTKVLEASVQTNTLAIVDVESQQALASWEVVAAASGGKPARLKIASSTLGSFVALDAPWIFFGDNTVFDDATDTMQTTVDSNIRIIANGAPFGAASNLLEWWGPSSIPLGSMTTANGYNGRMTISPYVFNNAVPDSSITVVSASQLGSSNGATNANIVSQSASVKLDPRAKISATMTFDGGSQMTGGPSATFIVEVFEQNGAGVTVLQSTSMQVTGTTGGPVTDLTGGIINTFPSGQMASKSGAVTYGMRVRRTGGSGNFINLRGTLYMEII